MISIKPLVIASFLVAMPVFGAPAHEARHNHDYALVLPEHLPHLMESIGRLDATLGLNEEQKKELQSIRQSIPGQMHEGFTKARQLETEIGQAVLEQGASAKDVSARLDELQRIKRNTTDLQISVLNRVKALLSAEQYQRVLKNGTE